ncbi:MAG TPA: glycoside hydrolase family 3 N-terminal domain-containing protein [Flavobacteriales bacterium]|nr:glycoside hydrolase family 3 N-terminal domain-containing protein [Flavobacteriales bacterium]HRJ35196.1 glycoside hydrolase family 3 N-terminal domain-containing protein [Flavobacteriales bacterium]HRJ40037.1 glycoside hydrolase family 3 N-terminal domain-containing protein [Flavobacteriales bacterium]
MNKSISILLAGAFLLLLLSSFVFPVDSKGPSTNPLWKQKPRFLDVDSRWADSLMLVMSPEERIAQLFMVAAYSNRDQVHEAEIMHLVTEHKVGGLIFFQGGPMRQAHLTNRYQSAARVPLMIGIDGEWGLAMRLDSTMKFPKQMTLGAINNDTLVYLMGLEIGRQCRRLGIHVNFAPVVDVNSNPDNPVINFRSFGEDRVNVARKSFAYMLGLQDKFVLANAKHFPGHGDASADSHHTLPVINRTKKQLDSLELFPFRYLIRTGLASIMVAHLYVPALEKAENTATTLSKKVVSGLLKKDMAFEGLVFTDALNMQGVSAFYKPGEVELKALLAGNDVLLFAEDVPNAINLIKGAIARGEISQADIDQRCRKLLLAKKWVGLDRERLVKTEGLMQDLHTPYGKLIQRKLYQESLTLLENKNEILPITDLEKKTIAIVTLGDTMNNPFMQSVSRYATVKKFALGLEPKGSEIGRLIENTRDVNLFIIGLHPFTNAPKDNYGLTEEAIGLVNQLNQSREVVLAYFGNAYGLRHFKGASLLDGLIMCYENSSVGQDLAAQAIFGGIGVEGTLPVNVSEYFHLNEGMCFSGGMRFEYTSPEAVGIRSSNLDKIDSLALLGIREKAYPGCQILIAKKGKVFYNKSFGFHTYENNRPVREDDIYDLASVTKITSTVAVLMHLTDQEKFKLDSKLGDYIPEILDSSVYSKINIRKMLAHEAGLVPWIPFYVKTLKNGLPDPRIYRTTPSDSFPYRVAENLYILKTYKDSIIKEIKSTPLRNQRNYLYSDVGYYLLQEIIQKITGKPLDVLTDSLFFKPLGATTLCYNPRKQFPLDRIPPEEDDKVFRRQLIQGDVHDQGAAMLGGVGGHAGLFASANDLAKMMQMLMNYGEYGGRRYLSAQVVKEYTGCQFCPTNRRGAGFDRPTMSDGLGPTCNCVSYESFGHTGFTGITAWADPGEDIIYLFLSNRSYPIADNNKILKMGLRTDIQQVIYTAIRKGNPF